MARKHITDIQVLAAQKAYWDDDQKGPFGYERLMIETGECEKVCLRCLERAESRGLLDYGVSLRTAWLTEAGEKLLAESKI